MDSQTSSWPPASGVTTPTIPRSHTVLSTSASTTVNAPAPFIFNILLDASTYSEWSNFIPKATVKSHTTLDATHPPTPHLALHTKFTFYAYMGPGAPTTSSRTHPIHLVITDLSTPSAPSSYVPAATLAADPTYTADLQRVYRVAWAVDNSGLMSYLFPAAERFHEVIVRGDAECEVRTWECQTGMVTHVVKWMFGATLDRKFAEWVADLKAYGEKQWEEEEEKRKAAAAAT